MIHITYQLDGERLREWERGGFADETVLVVPMGDLMVECGFRVREVPSHTQPTEAPRAATLDEIGEVSAKIAEKCRVISER